MADSAPVTGPDPEALPYPLAILLEQANQSHPEARTERLIVTFERGLALAASILAAAYLRHLEGGGSRLTGVDKSLSPLHRPSLGGWVQVLRALSQHLPPDTHPAVPLLLDALPPKAIEAAGRVVQPRNARFHHYDFTPETTSLIEAGSLAFLERLAGLGDLGLVAVTPEGDWYHLQGLRPKRLDAPRCKLEHPPAGPRVLVLAKGEGPALDLSPLVLAARGTGTLVTDVLLFHGRRKGGAPSHVGLGGEVVRDVRPDADELTRELTLLLDPEAVAVRHASTELVEEPFRKLRVFEPWDEGLFFGRDQRVRDLAELVDESKLVVLHGASGTGKSSLLRAGLRTVLDSTYLWVAVRPCGDPLDNLIDEVRQELGYRGRQLTAEQPHEALLELSRVAGRPVLLVLDQAEELFLGRSEEQSRELAAGLAREIDACRGAGASQGTVHVLFCLRDDYFGHLTYLRQAGLPGIFEHELILPPLDQSGARQALEEPLSLAGKSLAPGLARTIIDDLSGEGQEVNPVELELVCDALFQAAEDSSEIGPDLYQRKSAGKVLAEYLGQILVELEQQHLPEAWAVLKQMVTTAGTSREASTVTELAAATDLSKAMVHDLLQRLVHERLVQASELHDQSEEPRYRIAHDLVAHEILTLMDDDERIDLRLGEELRVLTGHWVKAGRPKYWFPVPREVRQELLAWQARGGKGSTAAEAAFLVALARWDRWASLVRRGGCPWWQQSYSSSLVFGFT